MQKAMIAAAILALAATHQAFARGGFHGRHFHGGHSHGHARLGTARPAEPTVPPSLTPDARVTADAHQQPRRGSVPDVSEKRDPQDVALDRKIKSICRGC